MRIFECVCAFMNFRQVPLSAGLWESAYSTVSATVSGCMWRRLAGVIRWVSPCASLLLAIPWGYIRVAWGRGGGLNLKNRIQEGFRRKFKNFLFFT